MSYIRKFSLILELQAIAALCLAMQVDRGRLSYDDLVVKYWPEYGQRGKHMTTIEDILTHKVCPSLLNFSYTIMK